MIGTLIRKIIFHTFSSKIKIISMKIAMNKKKKNIVAQRNYKSIVEILKTIKNSIRALQHINIKFN